MKEYLIGEKLSHSYSVPIHKAFGAENYSLKEIGREELAAFFAKKDFGGLNVTIPYKREAFAFLNEVSPLAERIGAVNTVVNRGGVLYGDNTDYFGFSALTARAGVDFRGANVLIFGTGGTSETAETVCRDGGAARVEKVSRSGALNYQTMYERSDTHVVVNTTPAGMFPNDGESIADLSRFPALRGALDAVYHPLRTNLVLQAEALGVPCAGGLYMLVAQAARARELFDGRKIAESEIEGVYRKIGRAYENAVLVGMPGSGKSAVGRALAARLKREFFDSDAEIERRAGPIEEIFARGGEETFRRIEKEVIEELSKKSGVVLATGGGAVKDKANVAALRRNGKILYIDRPVEKLALKGRPLSKDRETVKRLYEERRALYEDAADVRVKNVGALAEAEEAAFRAFTEEEE